VIKSARSPLAYLKVLNEVRRGASSRLPIAIGGASELVPLLAKELREGGDAGAVVEAGQSLPPAAALVWIGPADEDVLRAASRARTPIVGLVEPGTGSLPYVLDTNIVRIPRGSALPVEAVAAALARALGSDGPPLAARLPVIRPFVIDGLIRRFSRRNGLIGAAVFIPGVDLPILTTNEVRLMLQIAIASGRDVDSKLVPELVGIIGAAFGFRRAARELLDFVPIAGWMVKGGVAYSGTKAIGEAARRRFAG
jgi:uncharacterized protein (DUF697 family)